MADKPQLRVSYECASNGLRETTTASELSLGGLFIETRQKAPAKGAFVSMEIEAGSTKVAVDGRVLSAGPTGFSVSFIDLPNEVASALSFILATRMPRRGTTLGLGEAEEGVAKYVSERRLPAPPPTPTPGPAAAPPPPPAPASAPPAAVAPSTPPMGVVPRGPISAPPAPAPGYGAAPAAPTSSSPAMVPIGPASRPPPWSTPPPAPIRAPMPMSASGGGPNVAIIVAVIAVVLVAGGIVAVLALRH